MSTENQKQVLKILAGKERRALTAADLERMMLPREFWETSFGEVEPEASVHRQVIGKFMAKMPGVVEKGYGLLLWGPNGHGKSALASLVLKEARRWGFVALFVRSERLRSARLDKEVFDDAHTLFKRAMLVDVLVLDDLGKEVRGERSAFTDRSIEDLLRERVTQRRTTIITTNISKDKLDSVYPESLVHGIRAMIFPVHVEGHNYRLVAAERMRDDLLTE